MNEQEIRRLKRKGAVKALRAYREGVVTAYVDRPEEQPPAPGEVLEEPDHPEHTE